MSGGKVFYAQRRIFPKFWQRHAFAAFSVTVCASVAFYLQGLAYNRYNTFRGKTALYGTEPLEGGTYKSS